MKKKSNITGGQAGIQQIHHNFFKNNKKAQI